LFAKMLAVVMLALAAAAFLQSTGATSPPSGVVKFNSIELYGEPSDFGGEFVRAAACVARTRLRCSVALPPSLRSCAVGPGGAEATAVMR
jgi:hypothetical protein